MNEDNLVKLAKYILANISNEKFDMRWYRSSDIEPNISFYSKENCGTVGCALGWAPFVPGLEAIGSDYSLRVFGTFSGGIWDFVFSGGWSEFDNTIEGVVSRIVYLIEGGDDFRVFERHPYRKIDPNKINNY